MALAVVPYGESRERKSRNLSSHFQEIKFCLCSNKQQASVPNCSILSGYTSTRVDQICI